MDAAPQAADVVVERLVMAPPEDVFRAFTEGERLDRWFFTRCLTDPRPGGTYTLYWEAEGAPERDHIRYGTYLDVTPPNELVFEWRGLAAEGEERVLTVRVTLVPDDGGTRVRIVHSGWGGSEEWGILRLGYIDGWKFYLGNLARVLTGGEDLRAERFGQRCRK